jgi:anti-anti-sigma factor
VSLRITIRTSGDVTILDLWGRATIGESESAYFGRRLQELIANGRRKFLLNLSELRQLDSSGLSIIAKTCTSLRERDGDLRLLCPRDRVLDVLRVLRLIEVIPCFEDENQALDSFRPRSNFAKP